VTVLEFAPPELEEQRRDPPQEGRAEEEDLPECSNHLLTTYIEGKPQSIIRLLIFLLSCSIVK